MSYAGGSGATMVATKTAPGRRKLGNPESGHKSMMESPLPYRQEDPSEVDTRYCDGVGGIIPGYGGHRPRAQHNYGRSSFGDPMGKSHAATLRQQGTMKLHGDNGEWVDNHGSATGAGIDGAQAGHPNTKEDAGVWSEGTPDYAAQVGGVLPGYGGHVPRAHHTYGRSAVGQTQPFDPSIEHKELEELRELFSRNPKVRGLEKGDYYRADPNDDGEEWWPQTAPSQAIEGQMNDFRDTRNGILPKYAGHVPRSKDKSGQSAFGKTHTVIGHNADKSNSGVDTGDQIMSSVNRVNTKYEVAFDPLKQRHDGNGVIPGYRGHVPNVVNAVGMSTFLSGPNYTEVKVENMEKMGGLGDLGDSAAAYGCNDWGASSFSDGAADLDNLGGGPMADGHASAIEKGAAAQAGHIDEYTFGDKMADEAAAALELNKKKMAAHQAEKRRLMGLPPM